MSLLYFLFAHLSLVLFFGIYAILDRGQRHRGFNRLFLLLAPLCALLLPLLSWPSTESIHWTTNLPTITVLRQTSFTEETSTAYNWFLLYLSGIVFFLFRAGYNLLRAARKPPSERAADFQGMAVYMLKEPKAHYSFFHRIYLNPYAPGDTQAVLLHEYAHCRGLHTLDLLLCSVYRALFWVNPIMLLWERRMRENHEYIADHYVLSHNVDARSYAQVLFEATFEVKAPQLAHTFESKSLLRKRIENLTLKNQHHMKQFLIVPALAGLGFLAMSLNAPEPTAPPVAQSSPLLLAGQADKPAEFKGGMEALALFIGSETNYPKTARDRSITGVVYIQFEIAPNGKVEAANVAKSSGNDELDSEALRVINAMPDWNPAQSKGKSVRSEMTLPIKFAL